MLGHFFSSRAKWVWISAGCLTGCVTQTSSFLVPEKITFQGNTFERVTHSQIDDMQQMLYLPSGTTQDPDNWQKGVLIFLDKNSQGKTLSERAMLRQTAFAQQEKTIAKVEILGNELQSKVIYPPTERFNDVQLEVSRGRDLACGFGQIQFSDKRSVSAKKMQNLANYQASLMTLALQFSQLAWQIGCR